MDEKILDKLVEIVQEIMGKDYEIKSVITNKLNGSKKVGISISMLGRTISPIIYVNEIIEAIDKSEISIKNAAEQIVDVNSKTILCNNALSNPDKISEIYDKEYILNHVEYQVINAEQNIETLKNIPNKRVLDLAAIYRVVCIDSSDYMSSYVFENKHLDKTNISMEELDEAAFRNTKEAGFVINKFPEISTDAIPMYVLTNTRKVNGAVALLFNDLLAEEAEKIGEDVYIIPSSINDLIIIPASVIPAEELKNIIKNVNDTEVPEDEILSYLVYKFNVSTGEVEIAG